MRRFATWITGHRKTVVFGWIGALVVIGFISGSVGAHYAEDFKLPKSDSQEAFDLLEHKFPAQSGDTSQIVFKAEQGVESPAVKTKMEGVFKEIEGFPHVSEVSSPYVEGGAGAISEDGKIAYATIQFDTPNNKLNKAKTREIIAIAQGAAGEGLQVELGGSAITEAQQEEGDSSFGIGLLAAMVVLLITFGSVVAMGLPIITALFALGVGLSLVVLGTHVFNTANFATILAAMIGLGVGIDYALFILTRFRNGLDEGLAPQDAAVKAIDTAGRAVLFAGITVIIALLGMFLLGLNFLYGVAMAAALAVLFTMIAALTLLPALLTMIGHRVNRLRIPGLGGGASSTDEGSRWFRWSRAIQRRPVLSAVLSGGLLLLLCVPTLSLRLGTNDAGTEPPAKTTRKAYDLLAEGFGPGFNGPFVMVGALPQKGDAEGLEVLKKQLEGEKGVAATTSIQLNPAENTGVFNVYPTTSPQSVETTDLLDHIRSEVIPPIESKTGAQLHVGGINAIFEDFGNAITEKLPLFIGVVVLLSALLLM
ncbi:MAG: MMPL family transporter, partial [Actinobacteria bacterium]|nr:MMPL family transporter [Actinomycetota bacterium]